jgi:hypothetical protein
MKPEKPERRGEPRVRRVLVVDDEPDIRESRACAACWWSTTSPTSASCSS